MSAWWCDSGGESLLLTLQIPVGHAQDEAVPKRKPGLFSAVALLGGGLVSVTLVCVKWVRESNHSPERYCLQRGFPEAGVGVWEAVQLPDTRHFESDWKSVNSGSILIFLKKKGAYLSFTGKF